ncbi:hypothetical protein GC176_10145 [bacterium]|nr:hypothetical protein [bacterium]
MVVRLSSRLLPLLLLLAGLTLTAQSETDAPPQPEIPSVTAPTASDTTSLSKQGPAAAPTSAAGSARKSSGIPYPDDAGIPDRLVLPDRRPAVASGAAGRIDALPGVRHTGGPAGEYTTQQALLLAWIPDNEDARPVQLEIARLVCATTQVIVIAPDQNGIDDARQVFENENIADDNVTFLESPIDTPWVRDYGPFSIRNSAGQIQLIDAPYGTDRVLDDSLPAHLAKHFELPVIETSLCVEGGNLLSNGDGLLVCSTNMIGENQDQGLALKEIRSKLLELWHAREAVFVDPIAGEPTGHVDMLMTFPTKDTVLVGQYDEEANDPFNRQLLDETAERLQSIRLSSGRNLNVVRVPMPTQTDPEAWPTYCNVVYANGVLLIPYFPENRDSYHRAVTVFRRILPGWRIAGVDCSTIIRSGGALHCLTTTIPADSSLNEKRMFRGRRVVRVPALTDPKGNAAPRWRPPVTN